MSSAPLIPDATLRPPPGSSIAHPRPCGLRLVPSADGVSREVAHINNVEYVRWFVARHEVDYRAEVFPGDELHVFTWIRSVSRVTSWRDTTIMRARDGAVVCSASTCWALVDLATRKPARIPAEMLLAFEPLEAGCTSRSSSIPNAS